MWNEVKKILAKFEERKGDPRRKYENLTVEEMRTLREFYQYLNDEEIYEEIIEQI